MDSRAPRVLKRLGRILARVLWAATLALVFAASTSFALVLHLDMPAARRVAARVLSGMLSDFFIGRLAVGSVDHLSLTGLAATNVVVHDTQDRVVLRITQLRAKADLVKMAGQILNGGDKETLVIRHIRLEQAECELLPDETTRAPSIVRALTPQPKPKRTPRPPSQARRYVRVWMPEIEIGRGWSRGQIGELPTLEAELSRVRGSVLASPKGAAIIVRRFGALVRGLGGSDARGTGDLNIRVPGAIWTTFNGRFGDVEVGAFVRVDGAKVTAKIELPRTDPDAARALWPDWPLHHPLRAQVEAVGRLDDMQAKGHFELGPSTVDTQGALRLAGNIGADLHVNATDFDLRVVVPDAPPTALTGETNVSLWQLDRRLVVDVNATTQPTTISGVLVPAVDVRGRYADQRFSGEATLHERGMPVKLSFAVDEGGKVDFQARAPLFRVEGAPRLADHTGAHAAAQVNVNGQIAKSRLSANLDATLQDLRIEQIQMQQGRLTGTVTGPVAQPLDWNLDARLAAVNVGGGWFGFEQVDAKARGSARSAQVSAVLRDRFGPDVDASATVLPLQEQVRNLHVALSRGGVTIDGKVAHLDLGSGSVEVRDLRLSGATGTLEGSIRVARDRIEVDATGEDLDLDAISGALGLPDGTIGGRVSFSADVTTGPDDSRGRVRIAWGNGSVAEALTGVNAFIAADLDQQHFEGTSRIGVEGRGEFGVSWDTTLAGSPLDPASWRDITGHAEVGFDKLNLEGTEFLFPADARLERIDGHASGHVHAERSDPEALPNLEVVVATQGLSVGRGPADDDYTGESAVTIEGIDAKAQLDFDGETGETEVNASLVQDRIELVASTATTRLDVDRLRERPGRVLSQLMDAPVDAVITLPERPLSALPEPLRPEGVEGNLSGRLTLSGSPRSPTMSATARLRGLRAAGSRLGLPVDLSLSGQYEPGSGRFGARGEVHHGPALVAQLSTRGTAPWERLWATGASEEPAWRGEGQLLLQDLPLGVIPVFADNQVAGTVRGTVALRRDALLPQARGSLTVHDVGVERIPVGDGALEMHLDGKRLNGRLSFAHQGRTAQATARAMLRWGDGGPELDAEQPAVIEVSATRFDAVVLQPLLSGALSRLSGEVDAQVRAELTQRADPDDEGARRWHGRFSGSARLRHGELQLAGLGMTLNDVLLDANARHSGDGTLIEIPEISAKARSERHNLQGSATLYLAGLRFSHAQVALQTAHDPVPLQVQGVTLASASGQASAFIEHQEERVMVDVEVPELIARLPRSSERNLIDLDANDSIEVEQPLGEPEEPRTEDALPWHVVFHLGDRVRVVRSDMYVPVTGKPALQLGEEAVVTGYVDLEPGGRLQALGKEFVIKTGRLRFDTGDNGNPHVDVTAAWQAPDAIVYVEIHGTLEESEIAFRSDPPRPENEVIALLLTGTADEGEPGDEGSSTGAALGAGSQAAAPILDEVFGDTPLSGIKFRATATGGKPSYVAAYRVSDQVWLEGIYKPEGGLSKEGEGTSGESDMSEQSQADAFAGAIDWRFHRNWSLRTEAGNASAGLDILWQYRY